MTPLTPQYLRKTLHPPDNEYLIGQSLLKPCPNESGGDPSRYLLHSNAAGTVIPLKFWKRSSWK